ncbi:MAG TPA: lipoyl synthase [Crenotrichaceae bacterium]|nr:lipoyl synthase [Crenotrichaceae bacterium]
MSDFSEHQAPSRSTPETHLRNRDKLSRIPIKVETTTPLLRKPDWIRSQLPTGSKVTAVKSILRKHQLHSVCEEAACPNLGECFNRSTATFMILGDLCTRRCPFCDVAHGRPQPPDTKEPEKLAAAVNALQLRHVVITSVNRDDLRDAGAQHFADCIKQIRKQDTKTRIEILVPDFRKRVEVAMQCFENNLPDIFNHNLETVPRLYLQCRPGADYQQSLELLKIFKTRYPDVLSKSGLMLGLGETIEEVETVISDLKQHHCDMLTLGQYLQPSHHHLAVKHYLSPEEFDQLADFAKRIGFKYVASGPMVRSSYFAEHQLQK